MLDDWDSYASRLRARIHMRALCSKKNRFLQGRDSQSIYLTTIMGSQASSYIKCGSTSAETSVAAKVWDPRVDGGGRGSPWCHVPVRFTQSAGGMQDD